MKQMLQYKQVASEEQQQDDPVDDVDHIARDPSMPGENCDVNVHGASKKNNKVLEPPVSMLFSSFLFFFVNELDVQPTQEVPILIDTIMFLCVCLQGILFNRSSPMKITRVCKAMTLDQQSVTINADFGSMLGMQISKLIPELCRFLMGCFNPNTCELDFGDMGKSP
jgi:hypothetical protein